MRHTAILCLMLTAALFSLGCGTNSSPTTRSGPNVADAKEKIEAAAEATVVAARAKRDEYVREMNTKLAALDVKFQDLVNRAAATKDVEKLKLEEKIKVAKAKRDTAAKKLAEVKEASHDRWEKVKDGFEDAFDDLKKSFE